MAAPVVVSRIQNRRGTQSQFESLYPGEYISSPGATSLGPVITVSSTAGVYQYARPFVDSGIGQFAPGTQVVSVDSATQFTVNLTPTIPLAGAQIKIPKYNGTGGVPSSEYPGILMPGELALCTDSRRIFLGNINGEYVEIHPAFSGGIAFTPLVLSLPPSPTFSVISELSILPTPFFTLLYDVTDSISPDWNDTNLTGFSRNGEIKITAVQDFLPIPNLPFPPITSVGLSDVNTEAKNPQAPYNYTTEDISFKAEIVGPNIEISYMHNFPTTLTFSTSSIRWLPF